MSESPGLAWRYGKRFRTAWWICRHDIAKAGYPLKTRILWRGSEEPSEAAMKEIGRRCKQLQHEMLDWNWKPRAKKRLRTRARSGFVYFVQGRDAIKIGFAINVASRMYNLQHASPEKLIVLATIPGSPLLEKKLHRRFKSLKVRGEWFSPEDRLLSYIKNVQHEAGTAMPNVPNAFSATT